ncbi:MAG: hypothetical protein FD187_3163, partial [bacterium]
PAGADTDNPIPMPPVKVAKKKSATPSSSSLSSSDSESATDEVVTGKTTKTKTDTEETATGGTTTGETTDPDQVNGFDMALITLRSRFAEMEDVGAFEEMRRYGVAIGHAHAETPEDEPQATGAEEDAAAIEGKQPKAFDARLLAAITSRTDPRQEAFGRLRVDMPGHFWGHVAPFMKCYRALRASKQKAIRDSIIIRMRFGNVDPRALRAYKPLKRDLNPNEIHSIRLINKNAAQLGVKPHDIRTRVHRLREKGSFWDPYFFFREMARVLPSTRPFVARIVKAVGHRTLVVEVRGAVEANVVRDLFLAHHQSATHPEGTSQSTKRKKAATASAPETPLVVLEYGLTPESQENLRNLFSELVSELMDHRFVYLMAITGQLEEVPPDVDAEIAAMPMVESGVVAALAPGPVYREYIRLDVPPRVREHLDDEEQTMSWMGNAYNTCRQRGEMTPLILFLVSFCQPVSRGGAQWLLDFVEAVQSQNPEVSLQPGLHRRLRIDDVRPLHEEFEPLGPTRPLHLGFCSLVCYGAPQITSRYLAQGTVRLPRSNEAIVIATTKYPAPRARVTSDTGPEAYNWKASYLIAMDSRGHVLLALSIDASDGVHHRQDAVNDNLRFQPDSAVTLEEAATRLARLIGNTRYLVAWDTSADLAALGLCAPFLHCFSLSHDATLRRLLSYQVPAGQVLSDDAGALFTLGNTAAFPIGYASDGVHHRQDAVNDNLRFQPDSAVTLEEAATRLARLIGNTRYLVAWDTNADLAALGLCAPFLHCFSLSHDATLRRLLSYQVPAGQVLSDDAGALFTLGNTAAFPIGYAADLLTQGRVVLRQNGLRSAVRDCGFSVAVWNAVAEILVADRGRAGINNYMASLYVGAGISLESRLAIDRERIDYTAEKIVPTPVSMAYSSVQRPEAGILPTSSSSRELMSLAQAYTPGLDNHGGLQPTPLHTTALLGDFAAYQAIAERIQRAPPQGFTYAIPGFALLR